MSLPRDELLIGEGKFLMCSLRLRTSRGLCGLLFLLNPGPVVAIRFRLLHFDPPDAPGANQFKGLCGSSGLAGIT